MAKISELPIENTITSNDYCVCNAVVSGELTTITIKWSDLITALGLGGGGGGGGSVIAVKSVTKTDTQTTTNVNGSWTDITGLSITYTPTNPANKILVVANILLGNNSTQNAAAIQLVRGSTPIGIGDISGSNTQVSAAGYVYSSDFLMSLSTTVLDSPATSSSTTWKVQFCGLASSSGTTTINVPYNNTSAVFHASGISTLTIMEVTP